MVECDVIDYRKPKGYKTKDWLAMEALQDRCKRKIKKWCAADGTCIEVKRGRLYANGELVSKWKGWGLGAGQTYYVTGRGKYKKNLSTNTHFYEGEMKKIMSPFKIPIDPFRKRK